MLRLIRTKNPNRTLTKHLTYTIRLQDNSQSLPLTRMMRKAISFHERMHAALALLILTTDNAWGWIHLIVGVVVIAAGYGVFSGAAWARVVGITLASLSAIANFFFIPYQPVWAILIIALDVLVIAALAAYGPEEAGVR